MEKQLKTQLNKTKLEAKQLMLLGLDNGEGQEGTI